MKNAGTTFFLFIFVFCTLHFKGQNPGNTNELDNKYTPNASSIFNNLLKKNNDNGSSESAIDIKNSISFAPTYLFRQKAVFLYERNIANGLTIGLALGKAFGTDVFQNLYFSTFYEVNDILALQPDDILQNSTFTGANLFLGGSARLYFSGNGFEDGFVEFNYRRETMHYELFDKIDNRYLVDGDKLVDFTMNNFNFGFGFCGVTGRSDNITHHISFMVGLKNMRISRFEKVSMGPSINDYIYVKTGTAFEARILPSFNLTYAFGFGF